MIYQPVGGIMDAIVISAFGLAIILSIIIFIMEVIKMVNTKRKQQNESKNHFKNL